MEAPGLYETRWRRDQRPTQITRRRNMAQPIAFRAPINAALTNMERLRTAPEEHAEAVLSAYELLQLLHDRGVLNLLRGLVDGGDELISTVTTAVDTPE